MIEKIRCHVQKVLPTIYDDSLSYYEVLGKLITKVNEIIDSNNKMDELLVDIVREIFDEYIANNEIVGKNTHVNSNPVRYYIDGINGDDIANDGLSANKPFKTMTRWLSIADNTKNGVNDIRCYIVGAGVYEIPTVSFSNISTHITANVEGVVLKFTTTRDVKFYGGHHNIRNVKIEYSGGYEFATECTSIRFVDCEMPFVVGVYGGYCLFENCRVRGVKGEGATVTFHGGAITNTDVNVNAFSFTNCKAFIYGNIEDATLSGSSNSNAYVYGFASDITFLTTINETEYSYHYGLNIFSCCVNTQDNYIDALDSQCDLLYNIRGNCLIIADGSCHIETNPQ